LTSIPNTISVNTINAKVRQLQNQVKYDVIQALEPASQNLYGKHWEQFKSFLKEYLYKKAYSATSEDLAVYVAHLDNTGIKSATIRGHLSAISFYYKNKYLPTPTESFHISKLLTSYSKTDSPPAIRKPITRKILEQLITALKIQGFTIYEQTMLTALFSLMQYALLRIGEVTESKNNNHKLKSKQISLSEHTSKPELTITFSFFKHSKPGNQPMCITKPDRGTCPLATYRDYCLLRPTKPKAAFTYQDGNPLHATYVRTTLTQLLTRIDLDPSDYNTHSFRIGRASDKWRKGYTDIQIAMAGRWTSAAYKKYIKPQIIKF